MNYIDSIMEKYPPFISKEEEDRMIKKYLDVNDIEGMKNELVLRNVGLIRLYCKPWRTVYSEDECASFGIDGLLKAAERFNPGSGVRFSSYAGKAIRTWLRRNKKNICDKISEHGIPIDLKCDENGEDVESYIDSIEHGIKEEYKSIRSNEYYIGNRETLDLVVKMMRIVGCSDKVIRCFLKLNFLDKTLLEISKEEGISKERVRQITNKAASKIPGNIEKLSVFLCNERYSKYDDKETKKNIRQKCTKKLRQIITEGILK